ncbi:MAG: Mu transposase C-terminal domain-containing protein [Defluviitaleaceae bacterium]|nr:Mu transposase C-terminal domain-containing protein [Defluviitaleaceae bacterium]
MGAAILNINEVAELENVGYLAVYQRIQRSTLQAVKLPSSGGHGFQYAIEFEQLSEKAQRKYYARRKAAAAGLPDMEKPEPETPLKYSGMDTTRLTGAQREDIDWWNKVISDWQTYIRDFHKEKTEKTAEFIRLHNIAHPDRQLSERTLRRKYKELKDHGEIALADFRGQSLKKGANSIDEIAYSVFMQWWLDEARPAVSNIYRLTRDWLKLKMPELPPIPSEATFLRATKALPEAVIQYFRHGNKAFEDLCAPYILRFYEDMDSNEVWSADYHTLDFFVRDDYTGKIFRPHAIAWLDVRSRKVMSVTLCESANSDGTVIGLRKAVTKYGIPVYAYLDNGREFLTHDVGGRGRRKSSAKADYGQTIFDRLKIEMHNAKVKNAKAKVIERAFRTVTEEFSKLVSTYCGGTPENRPERLDGIIKSGQDVPLLSEIRESLEAYIEGTYNNHPSRAEGLHGKSPNECYAENLFTVRKASAADLELMMLRSANMQEVKRNGVKLVIGGEDVWFTSEELVQYHFGAKVYVRYNPEDLGEVHIYSERDVKLVKAQIIRKYGYNFTDKVTTEGIKEVNHRAKAQKRDVKDFKEGLGKVYQVPKALDARTELSKLKVAGMGMAAEAAIIEPVAFAGRGLALAVEEGDTVEVDLKRMTENARRRNNGGGK